MSGFKRQLLEAADKELQAATLGDLAAQKIAIFCWCNRCHHNAVLAVERVLVELGPALPVPEVGCHLRCSGCGSKDVATRPDWPSLGQVTRHLAGTETADRLQTEVDCGAERPQNDKISRRATKN